MDFDLVVIGAGAAGEAAGNLGGKMAARVAVIERDLVGGECGFWACMPSKSLLDSASRRSLGADYPWDRASKRRDWMISREERDYPEDASHVKALKDSGAEVIRGEAKIVSRGRVEVKTDFATKTLETKSIVVSIGSVPFIPAIDGLKEAGYWTSREATSTRELPSSIVVLGGGPVGVEMAQVYARFGAGVTLVEGNDRVLAKDHPNSSSALSDRLKEEGIDIRLGVRAVSVSREGSGRTVHLDDGSSVEGSVVLVAVGRRPADLRDVGIEDAGVELDAHGRATPQEDLSVSDGVFLAGDVAGGMMFTHLADYQGRIAAANALGRKSRADNSNVPRTTFTDPETASIGLTVGESRESGFDAFEVTQDFSTTSRGYTTEGSNGHVTAVIDKERRILAGVFAACPGATELIHEAVLAIKHQIPIEALADTIHAFPTGARVFGNLMLDALQQLS